MFVRRRELAALLNVADRTIGKYLADGMGGQIGSGPATKYEVSKAIEWHVNAMIDAGVRIRLNQQTPETALPSVDESKAALVFWQSEHEKHKTLTARGELIPMADAEKELQRHASIIRNGLMSFPNRVAPYAVGLTTEQAARQLLQSKIHELMDQISTQIDSPNDDTDDTTDEPDDSEE